MSWKYFENYYCFLRFFQNYTFNNTNIVDYGDPGLGFVNVALTGNLPSVTFIDPHFIELPPDGNCDGAPADIAQGQLLVNEVVNAVITNPNWNKTLLIITYDEHGGFYDHVAPPPAAQIAPGLPATYGVRVPAFIVSPWVTGGMVFGNDAGPGEALYFDHTSILKTIAARFLSANMPPMGARFEAANHLSSIMGSQARSGFFRPFIPYGFVFAPSGLSLEVEGGTSTPDVPLWQNKAAADSDAQKFAFEDAGGGHFYIRTFTGRLYLTVDAPTTDPPQALAVRQNVKYPAGVVGTNYDYQKWSIVPAQVSPIDEPMYRVVSAAFPDKVLQPLGASLSSETSVVVDVPEKVQLGPISASYMWVITNPVLDGGIKFAPPIVDPPATHPVLSCSVSSMNFSKKKPAPPPLKLTNTGTAPLIISSMVMGNSNFSVGKNCIGTIAPGHSCLVRVACHFTGAPDADLVITHNATGSPTVIDLSSEGPDGGY